MKHIFIFTDFYNDLETQKAALKLHIRVATNHVTLFVGGGVHYSQSKNYCPTLSTELEFNTKNTIKSVNPISSTKDYQATLYPSISLWSTII